MTSKGFQYKGPESKYGESSGGSAHTSAKSPRKATSKTEWKEHINQLIKDATGSGITSRHACAKLKQ